METIAERASWTTLSLKVFANDMYIAFGRPPHHDAEGSIDRRYQQLLFTVKLCHRVA